MENLESHSSRFRLFVIALLIAVTGCAVWYISFWVPKIDLSGRRVPPVIDDAATKVRVQEFCGACHMVPTPDLLPRQSWTEEIPKAYGRFKDSGRKDLKVPDQAEVIDYFVRLAPVAMIIPNPPDSTKSTVLFRTEGIDLPENYKSAGVSFLNVGPSQSAQGNSASELLLCDMSTGWVHRFNWDAGKLLNSPLYALDHPGHIIPCDFDRDGRQDFLVADLGQFVPNDDTRGSVVLLRSPGESLPFDLITVRNQMARVADVQLADLDGDGDNDFVVAEFGYAKAGRLSWLETLSITKGKPTTQLHQIDPRHGTVNAPIVDLDGDGDLDVIALISQEHETIVAFLNDGHGHFEPHSLFHADTPGFGCSGMELVDLDSDGDLDILFTNGDSLDTFQLRAFHGVNWLENHGQFEFEFHQLAPLPGAVRAIAADLDGDGDVDVAAVAFTPSYLYNQFRPKLLDTIIWLEQTGPGVFERHSLERSEIGHMAIVAGDFDGDTDLDLAVGEFSPFSPLARRWFTVYWNQLKEQGLAEPTR